MHRISIKVASPRRGLAEDKWTVLVLYGDRVIESIRCETREHALKVRDDIVQMGIDVGGVAE
jgi:hypothetical protein